MEPIYSFSGALDLLKEGKLLTRKGLERQGQEDPSFDAQTDGLYG
jgi:hypothetical protein